MAREAGVKELNFPDPSAGETRADPRRPPQIERHEDKIQVRNLPPPPDPNGPHRTPIGPPMDTPAPRAMEVTLVRPGRRCATRRWWRRSGSSG